ncbi:hypothetical protein MVG78_03270 [Roseomonas gilardii subsp. gilardii]|uniref:hypothetical protein n=1 Tax=Roseomonas gilardii TaxID=257708 RepID=UPI001FF95684|nr:hypothetical protein [Roseomonas gilardii]UPG73200.1 hypothetical protein MVG78_03270 [Roseomonas gilardii subsp. gilardii]
MTKLKPFADDAAATEIGGLKIENGQDRIALYGSLDLTRDKEGLALARELHALLSAALAVLEGEAAKLPQKVSTGGNVDETKNPFA